MNILEMKERKLLAINGIPNHLFIGMKPGCYLSDLVREVKKSGNNFIKENHRKITFKGDILVERNLRPSRGHRSIKLVFL